MTATLSEQHRIRILRLLAASGMSRRRLWISAGVDESGLLRFLNYGGNPTCDWLDKLYSILIPATRNQRALPAIRPQRKLKGSTP